MTKKKDGRKRKTQVTAAADGGGHGSRRAGETEEERKRREEVEDEEFEKQCERYCSYVITFVMVASPLYGLISFLSEYALRPVMEVDMVDMSQPVQQAVVITGGCDGMGAELARLMVDSGAEVTLGCRDMDRAEDAVRQIQLNSRDPATARSAVSALPLDLASLASTRAFASAYMETHDRLDILVLNAAITNGLCQWTIDGLELAFQVNYLGHFLLAELLLPTIQASRYSKQSGTGRVVTVTCPAALQDGALDLENLAVQLFRTDSDDEEEGGDKLQAPDTVDEECDPAKLYADSKLAQLVFSVQLERRLRDSVADERRSIRAPVPGVISLAVDPQEVATRFSEKGLDPLASPASMTGGRGASLKSRVLMLFPPFRLVAWVFGGIKNAVVHAMKRSVNHGAKAIYHAATSRALGKSGGYLYSDRAGPLLHCGRKAARCGRVAAADIPEVVADEVAGSTLWETSAQLLEQFQNIVAEDAAVAAVSSSMAASEAESMLPEEEF